MNQADILPRGDISLHEVCFKDIRNKSVLLKESFLPVRLIYGKKK